MQSFSESDLVFYFPDDWVVRKFDDTRAYQSLSGHGLKGVDFIALSPDGKLWLMEVKNYRPRFKDEKEYRAKRRPPAALAEQVATKFTDTHRLLRIVNRSLTRQWWFEIWRRWRRLIPDAKSNYWFWTEADKRAASPGNTVCVLWMETPEVNDDYDQEVKRRLTALLPIGADVFVVETEREHGLLISTSRP